MLKRVIFTLLSFTLLYADINYNDEIQEFDQTYGKANSDELLRLHNMLKNIYINSIVKNDTNLKIKSLQRLIKTSKKLDLDSSIYEHELSTLQKMSKNNNQTTPETPKSENDLKLQSLYAPVASASIAKKPIPPKPAQKQEKPKKPVQKVPKISIPTSLKAHASNEPLKILDIRSSSKGISLVFNKNIKNTKIKKFVLKGKSAYRYVYDIDAILTIKAKTLKIYNIQKIKISQYNKKRVRIVFTNKKRVKLYYSKVNDTVNIGYKNMTKIAKKRPPITPTPKIKKPTVKLQFNPSDKIIVIDAGHGGKDGGAQGAHGLSEKKIVLKTALKVGKELKSRGYRVYYTRTRDKFIQLRSRTKFANQKNADLFISIHANAAPNRSRYSIHGVETFFLSPARSARSKNAAALENKSDLAEMDYFSKQTYLNFLNREKIVAANKLALDVQQAMLNSVRKVYKVSDGGVREAPFWVLVGAQMPAILIEMGYITNPTEGRRLAKSRYQTLIAKGVANGVSSYFVKNNQ